MYVTCTIYVHVCLLLDSRSNGFLKIGSTQVPTHAPTSDIAMVPDVTFYDNPLVSSCTCTCMYTMAFNCSMYA